MNKAKKLSSRSFYVISGVGASMILSLGVAVTALMWHFGFSESIVAANYSTSFLITDAVKVAQNASPWALVSLNAFVCRYGIFKWVNWLKRFLPQDSSLRSRLPLRGSLSKFVLQRLYRFLSSRLQTR